MHIYHKIYSKLLFFRLLFVQKSYNGSLHYLLDCCALCFLIAKRLGVDPKYCLVFEDAVSGTQSGVSAGMRMLLIYSECCFTFESI